MPPFEYYAEIGCVPCEEHVLILDDEEEGDSTIEHLGSILWPPWSMVVGVNWSSKVKDCRERDGRRWEVDGVVLLQGFLGEIYRTSLRDCKYSPRSLSAKSILLRERRQRIQYISCTIFLGCTHRLLLHLSMYTKLYSTSLITFSLSSSSCCPSPASCPFSASFCWERTFTSSRLLGGGPPS